MPALAGDEAGGGGVAELHVAALGHEALDHAVEDHAVIGALAGQFLDARHVVGREIRAELDGDAALGLALGVRHVEIEGVFEISHYCTVTFVILSGLAGGSPLAILSTQAMPSSSTWPQTVYWPLRKSPSANMMKNWLLPELGSCERAMPTVPRLKGSWRELGRKVGLLGAAHAGAGRVARLGHEAVDHAVEDDAVIEAGLGQLGDLRHMLGRQVGPQRDGEGAALAGLHGDFFGGECRACEKAGRECGESQFPDHVVSMWLSVPFLTGPQEKVNVMASRAPPP